MDRKVELLQEIQAVTHEINAKWQSREVLIEELKLLERQKPQRGTEAFNKATVETVNI